MVDEFLGENNVRRMFVTFSTIVKQLDLYLKEKLKRAVEVILPEGKKEEKKEAQKKIKRVMRKITIVRREQRRKNVK